MVLLAVAWVQEMDQKTKNDDIGSETGNDTLRGTGKETGVKEIEMKGTETREIEMNGIEIMSGKDLTERGLNEIEMKETEKGTKGNHFYNKLCCRDLSFCWLQER